MDSQNNDLIEFVDSKRKSFWNYIFSKNPSSIGILPNKLSRISIGYESKSPDGFIIGNEEILGAIGCPSLTAEAVYDHYNQEGNDRISEEIELNMSPSRLSVLVGPEKLYEHLRILFSQCRFQDFVVTYKIKNKTKVIPLWKMENRSLMRIFNTRILVSELFNEEIKIKITDFALKNKKHKDLPVLIRSIIVQNLTELKIENVKIGVLLANMAHDWQIERNKVRDLSWETFKITQSKNEYSWTICVESDSHEDLIEFSNLTDIDDLDELEDFLSKNSKKILKKLDDWTIKKQTDKNPIKKVGFANIFLEFRDIEPFKCKNSTISMILSKNEENYNKTIQKIQNIYFRKNPAQITTVETDIKEESRPYLQMLSSTYDEWLEWSEEVKIQISDDKIQDLIDSLLTMLRCIQNKEAIHIGTLYYSHDSAFWRDNYWIQNAFYKAGRYQTALNDVDFFFNAWKKDGFKNSYSISRMSGGSANSRELRVEIPYYSSLMVKNLMNWTDNQKKIVNYYPMVKDSLNSGIFSKNNLCILNSDETWIWPAYVNEYDYYIDNSYLGVAAYDFGRIIAKICSDEQASGNYLEKRNRLIDGIGNHLLIKNQFRLATGLDNNHIQDQSLLPTLLSRPLLFNLDKILDSIIHKNLNITSRHAFYNGISLVWDVMKDTGVIRSDTRTAAIEGNTIGHYLHACSDLDVHFLDDLFEMTLNFSNCTGSVNEIHDMYNKKWGTGKQRSWDSSSLLEGILHYLYGINPLENYIEINPHLPGYVHSSKIADIRLRKYEGIVSCHKHGDNMEKSFFLKDPANKNYEKLGMPIPEIGILKTNLPGRIRYYDKQIVKDNTFSDRIPNYFAVQTEILPRFTDTNTNNQNIPIIKITNPIIESNAFFSIFLHKEHFVSLDVKNYAVDFPAHRIRMKINCYLDENSEKKFRISVDNKSKLDVKLTWNVTVDSGENKIFDIESLKSSIIDPEVKLETLSKSRIGRTAELQMKIVSNQKFGFSINNFVHEHDHIHEHNHNHDHIHEHKHDHNHNYEHSNNHHHEHDHIHEHNNNHDHIYEHNHDHIHEHNHGNEHDHYHNHGIHHHGDSFHYPFSDKFAHIKKSKPYWKPHPIVAKLDSILFGNPPFDITHTIIIYDKESLGHAREIFTNIAIIKQKSLRMIELNKNVLNLIGKQRRLSRNVILITKQSTEEILDLLHLHKIYPKVGGNGNIKESVFSILLEKHPFNNDTFIFHIQNSGDVYRDTNCLCQALNTYLLPWRKSAISMYPFGILRLSDIIGDKINEQLSVEIEYQLDEKIRELLNPDKINGYIQGKLVKFVKSRNSLEPNGKYVSKSILDLTEQMKGFKPIKPFISIFTTNNYVPIEVAASGISQGKHTMRLVIDCEIEQEIKTVFKIKLPQNFHPIWLRGKLRERTLEPTELIKNADGSKELRIQLNPGKEVHLYLQSINMNPKARNLEYIFGKYPRFPDHSK